jgi:RNA polymerase sigma factor (sigma-70 family)
MSMKTSTTIVPTPGFPERPTPSEVDGEYTPARVIQLANFVAWRVATTRDAREEAAAEATLAAYTRIDQYKKNATVLPPAYSFYNWLLFRILADVKDKLRRETRSLGPDRRVFSFNSDPKRSGRWGYNQSVYESPTVIHLEPPAPEDDSLDDRIDVRDAVDKLTLLQQELIYDYYVLGKSQVQIADERGVSQVAVHKVLNRAMEQLRVMLSDDGGDTVP